MACIMDLPNELLTQIIENVCETCPKTSRSLLFTCRTLYHPARRVLYEHVCLSWKLNNNSSMARFVRNNSGNDLVRSIRLQIQRAPLNAFMIGMKNAFGHLDTLCSCLPTLPRLASFSICLQGQVDRNCKLPGPVISRILQALPVSVVNLELDTEGADGIWEEESIKTSEDHLCHSISNLIPRLECLRLRLSCCCTDLFCTLEPTSTHQPTSNLRIAAMKLEIRPNTQMRPDSVRDCKTPKGGRNRRTLQPSKLFDHLLRLRSAGAFPYLQRFILLSWSDGSYIRVRDVATRAMTHYPFEHAGTVNEWRLPDMVEKRLYMIRDYDREDYFGDYEDIENAIMHELSWQELPDGSRLPPPGKIREATHRIDTNLLKHSSYFWAQRAELLKVRHHVCKPDQFRGGREVVVERHD